MRKAALGALVGLHDLRTTEPFTQALASPEPGISRTARRALEPRISVLPFQVLEKLAEGEFQPAHVRLNALALGNRGSKWERLPLLLKSFVADIPEVATRATRYLEGCSLDTTEASYNRPIANGGRERRAREDR